MKNKSFQLEFVISSDTIEVNGTVLNTGTPQIKRLWQQGR